MSDDPYEAAAAGARQEYHNDLLVERAEAAEAILRDLAGIDSPVAQEGYCGLCGADLLTVTEEHRPECPWLRAREWAATRG